MIAIKINFDDIFSRAVPVQAQYSADLMYEDVADEYKREIMTFMSGNNTLQGYLYGMENTKGLVVISHGLGGGATSYIVEIMYFVDNGYQVFGYDNTGCHLSEGKGSNGLAQSVIDLDAALTYIEGQERFADLPILLFGHSWGGYAVTSIFNYDHTITASASVAGYNKPMEMVLDWAADMMGSFAYVEYPFMYLHQWTMFGDRTNMSAINGINKTETPILIIHGEKDETIGMDDVGIMAYRDEITNPNVEYIICSEEKQNGHNNLLYSSASIDYREELTENYREIYDQYEGKIPDEVKVEWYSKVDRHLTSQPNEDLMNEINTFFEKAIKK